MPDSPALAQARRHAGTLAGAGRLEDAQALLERAIEIGRTHLAQGDAELLSTMRQLAGIHLSADDPMAARRVLEEALEVGHGLPDTDPVGVWLAHDLAVVAEELGNRHVARANHAKVAAAGPAVLGPEHPAVIRARDYLSADQPAPAPVRQIPAPAPTRVTPSSVPAARSRLSWMLAAAAIGVVTMVSAGIVVLADDDPVPVPEAAVPSRTVDTAPNTAVVSPANDSTVPWPFDAKFAVSAADATATNTVIALSICVAGHCYLDGKVDLYDGVAAPYTVYLGSTEPEGAGVPWQLRLDRLTTETFGTLIAERDAAIAAGTWGNTSTRMNALNPVPVSTLTVTKGSR
ncbi:tetratricopeptide repeat protein [Actinoplanes sp. NPDC026670]|uniref:tetratricopeptide repeat protein n=1 Tax=Actinoplanes sp. NPDC026670 TaxID=3154700 RepID=UPI0033D8B5C8